mgnify:CR=1 FL=1
MSPIAFPDLLQERGTMEKSAPARTASSSGGRLISSLRSRSRSRSRAQRRSSSCQPTERPDRSRGTTKEVEGDAKANRRSKSTLPAQRRSCKEESKSSKKNESKDIVDIANKDKKKRSTSTAPTKNRSSKDKHRSKTTSPPKRRPSTGQQQLSSSKKRDWGADIINLVDVVDAEAEDVLLSELLQDNKDGPTIASAMATKKKKSSGSSGDNKKNKKTTASPDKYALATPEGEASHRVSPKRVDHFPGAAPPKKRYSDEDYSEEESDVESDDEEDEDVNSVATNDLLEQVNARMEQQRLMEEVKQLRATVEKKNAEIDQLTGQLRMAISTKCDLVIAHTELERLHERDLQERDQIADLMKKSNIALMEIRAEVEKEFMNELTGLAQQVEQAETRRQNDLEEKEQIIQLLEEKIRRMERNALQGTSARPDNEKVKFYKKKLGVYDQ